MSLPKDAVVSRDMDEILIRSETQARDPEVKAEAKRKLERLEDGEKIGDEAMKGLDSIAKEIAQEKRRKRNKEPEGSQELPDQQEIEEKTLETIRKEDTKFRATLLQQSQRMEVSMGMLVAELQQDRANRAQEHRELLALMAIAQRHLHDSAPSASKSS